jgi:hypothetical protein
MLFLSIPAWNINSSFQFDDKIRIYFVLDVNVICSLVGGLFDSTDITALLPLKKQYFLIVD